MATPLTETIERLKYFQRNLDSIILAAVERHEGEVIEINLELLQEGIDGEGDAIQPPYAESTKRRKRRRGQPSEYVTLKDTGRFYSRVFLQFEEDRFYFAADVEYLRYLVKKYGRDILGIPEQLFDRLADLVRPDIQEEFNRIPNG